MFIGDMNLQQIQKRAEEIANYAFDSDSVDPNWVAKQSVHLNWLLLSSVLEELVEIKTELKKLNASNNQ